MLLSKLNGKEINVTHYLMVTAKHVVSVVFVLKKNAILHHSCFVVSNLAVLLYQACSVGFLLHRDVSNSAGKLEMYCLPAIFCIEVEIISPLI